MQTNLKESSDIDHAKVNRVRREIAAGTFVTEERLNVAADRLLDDLHNHGLRVDRVVLVEPHRLPESIDGGMAAADLDEQDPERWDGLS